MIKLKFMVAKRWLLGVATGLLTTSVVVAETFVFTAIPDQDEARLMERFGKVATYLSKELGVETKYVPVKSYAAAVTAFRNDQVQLAWFGGLSGVRARLLVDGSEAIAQGVEDPNFETYFIAHASTGLQPSEDFPKEIAGKTFTFGSKGSTSGRLMPEYYIRQQFGKAPDEVFSKVGFSGNHSYTLRLLEALVAASDKLSEDFGDWRTPWGEINRFQRLSGAIDLHYDDDEPSIAVGMANSRWGALADFGAERHDGTKRLYGDNGNSFVAVVEFGDRVRARTVAQTLRLESISAYNAAAA